VTVVTLKGEAYFATVEVTVPLPLRRRIEAVVRRSPLSKSFWPRSKWASIMSRNSQS
jgi:hypothetical protein